MCHHLGECQHDSTPRNDPHGESDEFFANTYHSFIYHWFSMRLDTNGGFPGLGFVGFLEPGLFKWGMALRRFTQFSCSRRNSIL